jgi:hypothetical protein
VCVVCVQPYSEGHEVTCLAGRCSFLDVCSLSIVYGFVKLVVHASKLKIARACLYGKTINGRVGV